MNDAIDPATVRMMWTEGAPAADSYAAFRGTFTLEKEAAVNLLAFGASWFVAWIDGTFAAEGPTRGELNDHEAVAVSVKLAAGKHVIAVQAHHTGETTRLAPAQPPFFAAKVEAEGKAVDVTWKVSPLGGYRAATRRINPQLGWIEWLDTRQQPASWKRVNFDDKEWKSPAKPAPDASRFSEPRIGPDKRILHKLDAYSEDKLTENFGYELDDIPARFFLRDLNPEKLPPQGVWRRYDLDRVRLGRLALMLDVPAGAAVEIAYAEYLTNGRVSPYITLSAGPSCNLDHFVARGGVQEFSSLEPRGGRFIEVHVLALPEKVKFVDARYLERTYHDKPAGSFECDDALLNRIWAAGVETYRACSEDAIIDSPTRERGQWTGDAFIGMETASAAFADLRLARRALVCAAKAARGDGLVSGLTPTNSPMSSYAAQWVNGCVRYYQLTGDRSLLEELFDAATKNLGAFEPFVKDVGLTDGVGWAFIDWGYARPTGPVDPALNLHYLAALRAMIRWCELVEKPADHYKQLESRLAAILSSYAKSRSFDELGYHVTALALRADLFEKSREKDAVEAIKRHLLNCFPNNPDAPRLSDPSVTSKQLITPYFAHYAFPPLLARGEAEFVLDQYRKCWGWILSDGRTTMLEVFDTRWSHCHQWSACPTWQLSRYVLGLHPRYDLAANQFDLNVCAGKLAHATGKVPFGDAVIDVHWERNDRGIAYRITSPKPIRVQAREMMEITGTREFTL